MKILHTADWHIGKKLHKNDLSADFDLFIHWLCLLIKEQEVDLLLVSGDIFDLANPSSEARKQYFQALLKLRECQCKIIMTGGNHDSPAMLEAPKELLRQLDIEIVGGCPEKLEDAIFPVESNKGEKLIVAAVPYLRESDLRTASDGGSYEDRLKAISSGIQRIYLEVAEHCEHVYKNWPALAMGHLFTAGMESSESEREIQIGNQAAFEASRFGQYFRYMALGHIHKPQRVSAAIPAFYSGSPLPLSFSEKNDQKRVLLIDTANGWEPESIPVPVFRRLIRISGSLEKIRIGLRELPPSGQLENLVEIELLEEEPDPLKLGELDDIIGNFQSSDNRIVKYRARFLKREKGAADLFEAHRELKDLRPKEVFMELLQDQDYPEALRNELMGAFEEILEEVQHSEESPS